MVMHTIQVLPMYIDLVLDERISCNQSMGRKIIWHQYGFKQQQKVFVKTVFYIFALFGGSVTEAPVVWAIVTWIRTWAWAWWAGCAASGRSTWHEPTEFRAIFRFLRVHELVYHMLYNFGNNMYNVLHNMYGLYIHTLHFFANLALAHHSCGPHEHWLGPGFSYDGHWLYNIKTHIYI